MKAHVPLLAGMLICLGLAGYYGYLIVGAMQKPDPVTSAGTGIQLDEQLLAEIRTKDLNGELPITVRPDQLGNTQPFGQ